MVLLQAEQVLHSSATLVYFYLHTQAVQLRFWAPVCGCSLDPGLISAEGPLIADRCHPALTLTLLASLFVIRLLTPAGFAVLFLSLPSCTGLPFLLHLACQPLRWLSAKDIWFKVLQTEESALLVMSCLFGFSKKSQGVFSEVPHPPIFTSAAGSLFDVTVPVSEEIQCGHCLNFHSLSKGSCSLKLLVCVPD